MTGENGVPETPDWLPESRPCTIFDIATKANAKKAEPLVIPDRIILGEN